MPHGMARLHCCLAGILALGALTGASTQAAEPPAAPAAAAPVPTAATASSSQHYPAQDYSFGEWMQKLQPVLKAVQRAEDPDVPQGPGHWVQVPFDWRHDQDFLFVLPPASPAVDWEAVPGGGALELAARYYVLASGDLTPTLGAVLDSGWWPYDTVPAGMDRTVSVAAEYKRGQTVENKYQVLKHIGTPAWVNEGRAEILRTFYISFFFDKTHGPRTAADLPARLPHFWLDPASGQPYPPVPAGDYSHSGLRPADANQFMTSGFGQMVPGVGASIGDIPSAAELGAKRPVQELYVRDEPEPWSTRAGQAAAPLPAAFRTLAGVNEVQLRADQSYSGEDAPAYASAAYLSGLRAILRPDPHNAGWSRDVQLDTGGERAPIEQLACPLALELAAKYYAIATLDNQVSLRDLVDSGFWPYDTFPPSLDLSETLYDFPRNIECNLVYMPDHPAQGSMPATPARMTGSLAPLLGTREWLLWRKAEILNQAHAELYFNPSRAFLPRQGVDASQTDILPRFAAFWTNPLAADAAGVPAPLTFGQSAGQLSAVDVNLLRPQFEGLRVSYSQQVPLLNLADKPADVRVVGCVMLPRRTDVQGIEQSFALRLPAAAGGGIGEVRWVYDEPTVRDDAVLLDTGWALPSTGGSTQAQAAARFGYSLIQYSAQLVPVGTQIGNAMFFGGGRPDMLQRPRLVYDGIAPLLQQAQLQLSGDSGYFWTGTLGTIGPQLNQFQQTPCGIDPLAGPSAAATPASLRMQ